MDRRVAAWHRRGRRADRRAGPALARRTARPARERTRLGRGRWRTPAGAAGRPRARGAGDLALPAPRHPEPRGHADVQPLVGRGVGVAHPGPGRLLRLHPRHGRRRRPRRPPRRRRLRRPLARRRPRRPDLRDHPGRRTQHRRPQLARPPDRHRRPPQALRACRGSDSGPLRTKGARVISRRVGQPRRRTLRWTLRILAPGGMGPFGMAAPRLPRAASLASRASTWAGFMFRGSFIM
jgi:hypothetical protein